jgi:hypothetical protein
MIDLRLGRRPAEAQAQRRAGQPARLDDVRAGRRTRRAGRPCEAATRRRRVPSASASPSTPSIMTCTCEASRCGGPSVRCGGRPRCRARPSRGGPRAREPRSRSSSRSSRCSLERLPHAAIRPTANVPDRTPRSWPPPCDSRLDREPAAQHRDADALRTTDLVRGDRERVGRPVLERDVEGRDALHRVDVQRHAALAQRRAERATSLTAPSSLFAPITLTSAVGGRPSEPSRTRASTSSTATRPSGRRDDVELDVATGREPASRLEHGRMLDRRGHKMAGPPVPRDRPGDALDGEVVGLGPAGGEHDVVGRAAQRAAACSRACSTARRAACPGGAGPRRCPLRSQRSRTSSTSGRGGVVAAWSRSACTDGTLPLDAGRSCASHTDTLRAQEPDDAAPPPAGRRPCPDARSPSGRCSSRSARPPDTACVLLSIEDWGHGPTCASVGIATPVRHRSRAASRSPPTGRCGSTGPAEVIDVAGRGDRSFSNGEVRIRPRTPPGSRLRVARTARSRRERSRRSSTSRGLSDGRRPRGRLPLSPCAPRSPRSASGRPGGGHRRCRSPRSGRSVPPGPC